MKPVWKTGEKTMKNRKWKTVLLSLVLDAVLATELSLLVDAVGVFLELRMTPVVFAAVWAAVFVFSVLILIFVREALALTLAFSSLNALVSGLFGVELLYSACVFLISYTVLLSAMLITGAIIKNMWRRGSVENAQKNGRKSVNITNVREGRGAFL
jgi:hypothetical protein